MTGLLPPPLCTPAQSGRQLERRLAHAIACTQPRPAAIRGSCTTRRTAPWKIRLYAAESFRAIVAKYWFVRTRWFRSSSVQPFAEDVEHVLATVSCLHARGTTTYLCLTSFPDDPLMRSPLSRYKALSRTPGRLTTDMSISIRELHQRSASHEPIRYGVRASVRHGRNLRQHGRLVEILLAFIMHRALTLSGQCL